MLQSWTGSRRGREPGWVLLSAGVILLLLTATETGASGPAIFDRVEEYQLDNGMQFQLLPRPDVPMVTGYILFKVGNVDNPPGQIGMAHMFEHMAFKGTDRIGTRDHEAELAIQDSVAVVGAELANEMGKREFASAERVDQFRGLLDALLERQAEFIVPMEWPMLYDGYTYNFNAYTSQDFTVYHATLPSNNLEAWMLMESERLQHPSFREFYTERDVVMEERREVIEDRPQRVARELMQALAFTVFPYCNPIIGYMGDIELLTQDQAETFYRDYYGPANGVAALVGDFDPAEARRLIEAYFGDIPARPCRPGPAMVEPPQQGQRRGIHRQGSERALYLAFPGYHPTDRRHAVARLLGSVLSRDKTSRLDKRLDLQEGAVRSIWTSFNGGFQRYAGVFIICAKVLEDFTNEQVEDMIWEELERVVSEPVTAEKLLEIQTSYRKKYYFTL
ncbi:MAG: pitrilysin family protein [bacterium]